ncbi:helix-turn-helix transcriptional regulator [Streptomyces sp. HNM0663]|uniref:Helix-turn-helix transcriptional regulator n=1 Tax=Streptomyces chengmaiensis TaxID=3040919 RepID=A0ABT6HLP8_9ACTN|nr:helix-turn-helix transcriptional regulator [Streptomyces chengmaiensis]MDH2389207.1 helix-turn-helix transcriptional regulator [Streptomyces chengmaiensis]
MLELLGLDAFTEAVYRAMLARPRDDAAALARHLGASEESVRGAWDRLAELSLIQFPQAVPSASGSPHTPRPISPELGFDYRLAQLQAELARNRQRISAARATASRLLTEYAELQAPNCPVAVEHLPDVAQVRARLAALSETVEREVMAFAPGGAQTEANMMAARPLNEWLLGRGVAMRTVYLDSVRNDPATVAHARWLTELGGQVRTVATLPIRLTLIDREAAVVPVDSEDSAQGAVVLTGQGPLTALCTLFEVVWETAQPLGQTSRRGGGDELDRQEAAALRLLAEGHTDEGIAKRLGLSHRTARRIATVLMERLGARSRFEAGVRAVQRGWLPRDL